MLEVQEERPAAGGTTAAHFTKKERGKKERDEAKDVRGNLGNSVAGSGGRGNARGKAPHTHGGSPHQLITPPCSVVLGAPSMHATRLKNSPSANTQSPKPKPEVMVCSPPVRSPSGGTAQMDSKLTNQSKPGSTGSQSQASPCDPKSQGGAKSSQQGGVSAGMGGLKNGQGLNSGGQGSKVKVKRERSTSVESYSEQQPDMGTPTSDDKEGSRVKRMCVAERRQPYSGADWCSGGESDEDDKGFFNCNSSDVKPQDSSSHPPSITGLSRSSTPSHNALGGQGSESTGGQKTGSKFVYVFTTDMANKAADAVLTGHSENIINFHMKNISNSKDKTHLPPLNHQTGSHRGDTKPPQQSSSHPSDQNHQTGSKPGLSDQAQPPPQGAKPGSLAQDGASSAVVDAKILPGSSPGNTMGPGEQTPGCQPQSEQGLPPLSAAQPGDGPGSLGMGQPGLTPQQQQQQLAQELLNMEANTEGLSQEQLEHRQRSLQTLRDIQRMLFPDDRDAPVPAGPHGGPQQPHDGMPDGGPRRPEQGPLQAMMAQSQSLGPPGGPGGPRPQGPPFGPPHGHPRDMPPFPDELGHMMGPGGCGDGDHMTPEQVAWLKLQQEFYEEKKRKQEMHHRTLPPDMMMHPHGPRGMMRGPPPPYQMGPGEGWVPGGPGGPPEHYQDRMAMGPRGPTHMQRMPGFPQGMMNPEMEGPPRPGMGWPDDMPPRMGMGDGRGFPGGPGGMFGGPGARGERFPNPQSVQEAMFHQGMGGDKGPGLPPQMMMEMQRMMGHQRGGMDQGNGGGMMFPRMASDGPMSPSSRLAAMGNRDMGSEFGMGPGSHGNPRLREGLMNMSPEEMMRMRGGPPMESMGPQGRQMQGPHFPDQPQPGDFPMGPGRPFAGGPGGMRGPHGEQGYGGPEHRTTPTGGSGRLNHLPLSGGPQGQRGRKPADLNIQPGGASSPSLNALKSPPLRQVQSPMMGSPSGNLKSPQTPSQLAGILSGAPGPNGPPNTANSGPMKSPHSMMGSAGASPVHMRSPSLPNPSPGWASSPKPPMSSPGLPQQQGGKPTRSMTSPNMMGNMEQGGNGPPSAPPSSGAHSGPMPLQGGAGGTPTGSPYSVPPEPTLSQNPLSIMMSRMSKFAMPSSTPLYHDAIKTVASSDDDSPPARSPNLPPMSNNGMGLNHHQGPRMMGPGASGAMPALSPLGMTPMGSQPLSHGMSQQMPSPNPPNMMPHGMMIPPNPQDQGMGNAQMMSQGRMGYPHRGQGYPHPHSPSQQGPFSPHNGPGPQGFPGHAMGFQSEGGPMGGRMVNMPHGGGGDGGRPNNPGGPQFNMHGEFNDSDLHDVMRTGASGMPEFDLSRIIPSEKPSQTLSYFPRGGGDGPGGKPPHMQGMIQGMMAEGPPRMGMPMGGMSGGPGVGMGPQDMPMGNPLHNPMRPHGPPGFMGQGMMGPQHRMMSPGGPGGMMQGKERGVIYNHPGAGGSPNMMMSLQGMGGSPQQTMMMGVPMRPRDMDMGFSPGPGMF
ncbi:hypothetical protein UPYG_G00306350 [Umbra pygmaea]|uniref:B-cell lymphoma 9 beta-catenin binding domain-containing protein n=1 Tax=Umbra pygmaea TaxID=75934 RepID=A0ABD0WGR7_UMBPY